MEGGVAVIGKVGVLEVMGVVFYDSFEEGKVLEMDRTADSSGWVNPGSIDCKLVSLDKWRGKRKLTWFLKAKDVHDPGVSALPCMMVWGKRLPLRVSLR